MARLSTIAVAALVVSSIPCFLLWMLASFVVIPANFPASKYETALMVSIVVAGWWGWLALGWLLVMFDDLGRTVVPKWVLLGLLLGSAVVVAPFWSQIPVQDFLTWNALLAFLLLGGAPLLLGVHLIALHWRRKRVTRD